MEGSVLKLFAQGVAPSTQRSYSSALQRYISFCHQSNNTPFPVEVNLLCCFVAWLVSQKLKHQSIKCYLSAIRYGQIAAGFSDSFRVLDLSKLEYVLKGVKRQQAVQGIKPLKRLPITPAILSKLRVLWLPTAAQPDYDSVMLWAACCLGFFAFLRCAEFTCPSLRAYDPGAHLSLSDIALDSHINPSTLKLTIKASKTDPFRQGVSIFLASTELPLCPVSSMISYLAIRGPQLGPLFLWKDASTLSRESLVDALKSALTRCGFDTSDYNGHSFRIGAATTAAARGIADSTIKMLSRWQSSAYSLYIKTPRHKLAAVSHSLAQP